MSDTARIRIHMSADEVARLDEIRGEGTSRSAFVRELIRRAGPLPFGRDAAISLFARRGTELLMPQAEIRAGFRRPVGRLSRRLLAGSAAPAVFRRVTCAHGPGRGDATMGIAMTSAAPTRVLLVAHRTAATPRLLDEVRARARRSPCRFTLLVPRPYWDPDTDEAAITLELAIPLLTEAAGGTVEGIVGDTDPFVAVQQALERGDFDELIISTLPARVSRWLRRDLPHRVEAFGLPVSVVTAE